MKKVPRDFVHPLTKVPLLLNENDDLCAPDNPDEVFKNHDGSYDFASHDKRLKDRAFYDKCYEKAPVTEQPLRLSDIKMKWHEESGFESLLSKMGDLHNKRVLLLGNGMSEKELYFVTQGADVVYTDLSICGVRRIKDIFFISDFAEQFRNKIEFHAVDALHLPFADKSFDVIYGCAFAHHIQNLDLFFIDVARCLKIGGECVFFDDAYSGLWNTAKNTILKPMQLYSHKKTGISPEDKLATKKGGFKKHDLEILMKKYSFRHMTFDRTSFFEYLIQRGADKLGVGFVKILLPLAQSIDRCLKKRTCFISNQGIRLVWGFKK